MNDLSSGSFDTREYRLKTWVEGNTSNINSIENEIRKFCFENNITIITLEQRKSEWLMRTLYIELKGDYASLDAIKKYFIRLEKESNN